MSDISHLPSPNFDERPDDTDVDLVVIHAISLPPGEFGGGHVQAFFQNDLTDDLHPYFKSICDMRVSSHFLIERDGRPYQFVGTDRRAWHCGESRFHQRTACNDFSVGIELEGCDELPFEDSQYQTLVEMIVEIARVYPGVSLNNIVGHSDIAPGRKTDPGPCFDWERLRVSLRECSLQ